MICEAEPTTELRAELSDAATALKFMWGGNAKFTLQSLATGTRYTYRVKKSDNGKLYFVGVLTGQDNENDYPYLGHIYADSGEFVFAKPEKAGVSRAAPSAAAFAWAYPRIKAGAIPAGLAIWHEGRCGRCSRVLTVPESIASGFGPECIKKG